MKLEMYEHYADRCFRDTPSPCSSGCPFDLDVRKFIEKIQSGKWNSAYSTYREQVLFPVIVSTVCHAPCRGNCVREKTDRGINIRLLEQAASEKAADRMRKFRLPQKQEKIAVIGAGMEGLSCAHRLLSHGYSVDVYEKKMSPGGRVLAMMDPETCHKDIEKAFSVFDRISFFMGAEVNTVDEMDGYDAIFISFPGQKLQENCRTDKKRVFCPDETDLTGFVTEQMACGLKAAREIEEFFKLGDRPKTKLGYEKKSPNQRYYTIYKDLEQCTEYTDPAKEASRCLLCNCNECGKVCPVIEQNKKYPPKIMRDIIDTLKTTNVTRRPGVRMIAGCTSCGKCKEVCPENIDMGACFREARRDFFEEGNFAPAFHDYWMRDLSFTQSEHAYYLHTKKEKVSELFFPGCQMGASEPELVKQSFAFLEKVCDQPALLLSCCGVPAEWAGDEAGRKRITDRIRKEWERLGRPVFIMGCTACQSNINRYLPEVQTTTLYQWMAEHIDVLPLCRENREAVVFDPCGAGSSPEIKKAVRSLAKRCGVSVQEGTKQPSCCGFGGHIYPANTELFETLIPNVPVDKELIVYCSNCRDVFAWKGFQTRHVLELIFGYEANEITIPDLMERRENRKKLKQYYAGGTDRQQEQRIKVKIPEQITREMNRLLILEDEVQEVIREAEDTNEKFSDPEQGLFYAKKQFQHMTVWVCYRKDGKEILVADIYLHHLEIKE